MGMAITDGNLLQPADVPIAAPIRFDWEESVHEAVAQRPETRRQRWLVKQKELELTAARNFLLPRFDIVGNYRLRGLGNNLTGGGSTLADDVAVDRSPGLSSALSDLASGDFQEVQLGLEYRTPIGFRRGHAAARHAELDVQREKAILNEQIHRIVLDLSNAISEVRRSYSAKLVSQQRFDAANKYFAQAESALELERVQIDVKLEAQRRILESQLQFLNAEAEYAIAVKNVHVEKGTYLRFHGIDLAESISSAQAFEANDIRIQGANRPFNYVVRDSVIAHGAHDSQGEPVFETLGDPIGYTNTAPMGETIHQTISDNPNLTNPNADLDYWGDVNTNLSDVMINQ